MRRVAYPILLHNRKPPNMHSDQALSQGAIGCAQSRPSNKRTPRRLRLALLAAVITLLSLLLALRVSQAGSGPIRQPRRFFQETQATISGELLRYWESHGEAATLGFPLTSEFSEAGQDGEAYRVQYFENVVLKVPAPGPSSDGTMQVISSRLESSQYAELLQNETWPTYTPDDDWKQQVTGLVQEWKRGGSSFEPAPVLYTSTGEFMDAAAQTWENGAAIRLDADGVPMVRYGDQFQYNPATVSRFCLSMYGKYLRGEDTREALLKGADKLLALQDPDGAFRYRFPWTYYLTGQTFEPGWTSGFAQGQALSAFSRLYHLTGDKRYLEAGRKALQFLLTPTSEGGPMDSMAGLHPSLSGYSFFQEYTVNPGSYVLNGYMATLLGLYDWAQVPGPSAATARIYFDRGIVTLHHILPYYDIGGISSYDMAHVTYNKVPSADVTYHVLVLRLLANLDSITHDDVIEKYETLWQTGLVNEKPSHK